MNTEKLIAEGWTMWKAGDKEPSGFISWASEEGYKSENVDANSVNWSRHDLIVSMSRFIGMSIGR